MGLFASFTEPVAMRTPMMIAAVVVLAACSKGDEAAPASTPASAAPAAILGETDLNAPVRVVGTEPFWSLDVTPQTLTYAPMEGEKTTVANPGPTIQGTTAVYAAAAPDGTTLVVTLIATECSDGMSDRVYPLTARIEMGPTTLNGCAASVASLDAPPQA